MPSLGEWKSSYISGWKKSFDYKSKSSRLDFISFNVIFLLVYVVLSIFYRLCLSFSYAFSDLIEVFSILLEFLSQTIQIGLLFFLLGTFVSIISLTVRRLRDMGKRWWWVFWFFIPIISFFFTVWLFITPSIKIDQHSI